MDQNKPQTTPQQQILILSCQNIADHCNVPLVKQYLQAFVDGVTALSTRQQKFESQTTKQDQ